MFTRIGKSSKSANEVLGWKKELHKACHDNNLDEIKSILNRQEVKTNLPFVDVWNNG